LCLVCHREDYIAQAYEELIKATQREPQFAKRVADALRRILAFKKKSASLCRNTRTPSGATVEKLSRKLWEFGEQVRLQGLIRTGNEPKQNARRVRA
jgi:hypothetical protein